MWRAKGEPQPHAGTAIMGRYAHVQVLGGLTAPIELRAGHLGVPQRCVPPAGDDALGSLPYPLALELHGPVHAPDVLDGTESRVAVTAHN